MRKEEIRKEFFKLRIKQHSYNQCKRILKAKHSYEVTIRTLKRWAKRLDETEWDLKDCSRKPKTIHYKITSEIENKVIALRKKTGWGEHKIANFYPNFSHTSIYKILRKYKLCNPSKRKKKRIKYVRWQRKHPNSLWQVDISDQKIEDKYCLAVIDDCSRYCLALVPLNRVSTLIVTKILDDLIKIHGKPREIKFDRWCRKRGIVHIRSAIHSPTTLGKVERLSQTLDKELSYCDNDPELFRMRYNQFRPHTSLDNKPPSEVYFRW